jgi:hypothetical protein
MCAVKGSRSTEPAIEMMTWEQAVAWRAARQHLVHRAAKQDVLRVAKLLCGLHAQVMSSAELTLWARVEGITRADVRDALWTRRRLVKTWAMRGTLHLLPSDEFSMWIAGLRTYRHFLRESWLRYMEMTAEDIEGLIDAIGRALDGRELSREELSAEVTRITKSERMGEKLKQGWGSLLKPAAFMGTLCFAPSVGQNVRFTRPDRWLGRLASEDGDEALDEITRRYLRAYAPATREDYARWWAGMTPAQAGKRIERLGDEVARVDVEGRRCYMLARDVPEATHAQATKTVRLLPAFDQYVVTAPRGVDYVLPAEFKDAVYRKAAWLSPVVAVDGRMRGIWRQSRKGGRLLVEVEPFKRVAGWVRTGATEEAERLAAFTGMTLEFTWST